MPQLDNYLVTLGMKGQNVVLSVMDKIRKKSGELTKKKTVVTLATKTTTEKTAAKKEPTEIKTGAVPVNALTEPDAAKNNKKFRGAVDDFRSGARNFSGAAASLDPTATVAGITSALGTALSGISVLGVSLGRLPEGIAAIANNMLSMSKNSIDMAKQATAAYHGLATRNAAAETYGEKITKEGPLSRNERAMFIDAVSNSMGRIGKPLADEINKLVGQKDTRALARAGAGDWESTGTDKGWMLGQMSSSFAGLPPSIKQKLQAALLKNYSGEIQNMTPGQAAVQQGAATFANIEEDQTQRLYDKSAESASSVTGAIQKLNDLQVSLFTTGLQFTKSIDDAATALAELPATISKMHSTIKKFVDDPSMRNARELIKSVKVGK